MDPKVAAVAAVPVPKPAKVRPTAKAAQRAEAQAAKEPAAKEQAAREPEATRAPDQVQMRLVIEMDQASGSYVYKTINRLTGEVLSQLPRAEVLKLKNEVQYAAGDVIRTEA